MVVDIQAHIGATSRFVPHDYVVTVTVKIMGCRFEKRFCLIWWTEKGDPELVPEIPHNEELSAQARALVGE